MNRIVSGSLLVLGVVAVIGVTGRAGADGPGRPFLVRAWLTGFEETPSTLSSPGRGFFRSGENVSLRVRGPVADQEPVTCVIPGHHRSGTELHADLLQVEEGPLSFELRGKCGFATEFSYSQSTC